MTYLRRYLNGEREQVWKELVSFGPTVREPQLIGDATAVAQETMTRVATNVDTLLNRLQALGYRFLNGSYVYRRPDLDVKRRIADFEYQTGPLPLSLRSWYEIVGDVDFQGSQLLLSQHTELEPDQPADSANILRAGFSGEETLGSASGDFYSDPLVIIPLESLIDDYQELWQDDEVDASGRVAAALAPDFVHKAGVSGGPAYSIHLPDAAIDGQVLNLPQWYEQDASGRVLRPFRSSNEHAYLVDFQIYPCYFVEYLRICFRWGGFPGFAALANSPPPFLNQLAQDLVPF